MSLFTEDKILRLPAVKSKTGIARSTIYSLIARGDFPQPLQLGARSVGWLESDINQWICSRRDQSQL